MTLMFGTVLGLLLGVVLGRRWYAFALAAAGWYLFLSLQTAFLAHPGQTGFGGKLGTDALTGPAYWLEQPAILALTACLLLLGSRAHDRLQHLMRRSPRSAA